jgi:hypothetical protein
MPIRHPLLKPTQLSSQKVLMKQLLLLLLLLLQQQTLAQNAETSPLKTCQCAGAA